MSILNVGCFVTLILCPVTLIQGSPAPTDTVARLAKSQEMLKYINTTADPCEDFYVYTCGNYAQYHPTDIDTMPAVGPLEALKVAMDTKIEAELQLNDAADNGYDKQVKNFYRSCIAAPAMDRSVYANKLKAIIGEFGQMPVLASEEQWQEHNFNWLELVAKIGRRTDESIIFAAGILPDFYDNTKNSALIVSGSFSLEDKSYYVDDNVKKLHPNFIEAIAKNLHNFLNVDMALANRTAKEIFEFEVGLAQGLEDDKSGVPLTEQVELTPVKELQQKYMPEWDTEALFNILLDSTPSHIYAHHKYLSNAKEVIKNTPKRVMANYIFYTYVTKLIYKLERTPVETKADCLQATKERFFKNLDNLMYRKHFTPQHKEGIYAIWQDLKTTFEEVLQSPRLEWMHENTRKHAVAKLKAMQIYINSYEDYDFAEEFKQLNLKSDDYVHNLNSILVLKGNMARAKADLPPQPLEKSADSSYTPMYSLLENKVDIPVALLMPYHFWSTAYPYAYNFANLGFYIAHEIVHGFDDAGRFHDLNGNNRQWWDSHSAQEFERRQKCFVQQYAKYEVNGEPLGEQNSQAENIADNGGVRLAYEAYLKWHEKSTNAQRQLDLHFLPNLDVNDEQLFFISYGQTWCFNIHPVYATLISMTDIHMPDKFRVIGPLSNFEEFSKAFNCPKGSGMNPLTKCKIY